VGHLSAMIDTATTKFQEYRLERARLSAQIANGRYAGETAKASARDRELFIESIKLCSTEFKDDAVRRKACLDQVIPVKQ